MYQIIPCELRAARIYCRMSLSAVARQLGKDRSTVWRYEHGQLNPPASTLFQMAEMYGVPVETLCRRQEGNPV